MPVRKEWKGKLTRTKVLKMLKNMTNKKARYREEAKNKREDKPGVNGIGFTIRLEDNWW